MQDLKQRAFNLLILNKREGYSRSLKRNYFYISPDKEHFYQWFWDSCFHAIVMAEFNPEFSIREIDSLFSCQLENGFIPHIIFWKRRLKDIFKFKKWWKSELHPEYKFFTAEIQPPVIGITLEKIFEKTKDLNFLKEYLPKAQKFFEYLKNERDPDKDFLISIITPMESGMDMGPQFDIALQNLSHDPYLTKRKIGEILKEYRKLKWSLREIFKREIFDFEDAAFNTIYALSLKSLSNLWSFIDKVKSEEVKTLYEKVKEKIIEKFWDEKDKIFYGIYHRNGRENKVKVKTISSLFPLCLDIPEIYVDFLLEHITNPCEFWLDYPLPSVSKNEKSFGPLTGTRFLWRGTTWINTNWFLYKGLLKHNKGDIAKIIKEKSTELINKFGFCEFYDPFTGNPGKAMRNFSWSTLIVDF